VLPDPRQMSAISQFPAPVYVTGVKAFLLLLQQLTSWSQSLAQQTMGMRGLLKKRVDFKWTDNLQQEFQMCQDNLAESGPLCSYEPTLMYSSRIHGLGYIFMPKKSYGTYNIIECGSCATTSVQRRVHDGDRPRSLQN
jgi:hypothetical protein